MCPFDTVDVTESGEFISFKNGDLIPFEQVEEHYDSHGTSKWPVKDEYIFLRAREFFQSNPKEQEVHIDCPSRGIDMLIDRNHPEIGTLI